MTLAENEEERQCMMGRREMTLLYHDEGGYWCAAFLDIGRDQAAR